MMLLVDIGNSRIKWTLWERNRFTRRGQLFHCDVTPAQLGNQLWGDLACPAQIHIANVAGSQIATALQDWVTSHWGIVIQFATTEAANFGIQNAYLVPQQMGVDRWVAMIGARAKTQNACCVVDCGTAITIDALSSQGVHQGGVIFPGSHLMRKALFQETRQIPLSQQGRLTVFGNSTQDCVWGGTLHAVAAAIDGITARMAADLENNAECLLSGGDAENLLPYLQGNYQLVPDLIFEGLLVIANQGSDNSLGQRDSLDLIGQCQ